MTAFQLSQTLKLPQTYQEHFHKASRHSIDIQASRWRKKPLFGAVIGRRLPSLFLREVVG